jgi:predicted kinase
VAGPAACGKTTFATALARRLRYALFDLDQVTGPLSAAALSLLGRAEHAFDEAGPGQELREARYASLLDAARANVAIGRGVVVAAPFTRELAGPSAWRDLVARLTGRAPAPVAGAGPASVALVFLECPRSVVLERLRARGAARDRLKLEDPGAVEQLVTDAPPRVPHLVVDGTIATEDQVERALAGLGLRAAVAAPTTAGGPGW